MEKHIQINDLQARAFRGDEEALELYNVYVARGEAPALHISAKNTKEHSQALMAHAYDVEAEKRGDGLFDNLFSRRELTEAEVRTMDTATQIGFGYDQRAKMVAEHKEKMKNNQSSIKQAKANYAEATQSSTFVEMFNDNK